MARSTINPVTDNNKSSDQETIEQTKFKVSLIVLVIAIIVTAVLFCWGRTFKFFNSGWIADNTLLGTYGDFFGGFIGTCVAFYSVYLLYKTLQAQIRVNQETHIVNNNVIKTNESVIRTNRIVIGQTNLQLFDNKFTTFLQLYKDAIRAYRYEDKQGDKKEGREAYTGIMQEFMGQEFHNASSYLNRTKAAVKLYESFYANHAREMSVHLRMLYNVVKLIGDTENEDEDGNPGLKEEDRVIYAKSIRAQLSDEEMIMLRYNCHTDKGKNMQYYVNEFNLIKHLPIMSLLEFRIWQEKIKDDAALISYANAHFISLRKRISNVLNGKIHDNLFIDTRKYQIIIDSSNEGKKLTLIINIKNVIGGPGIAGTDSLDKFLDKLDAKEIGEMYKELLREFLLVSNFYRFNGSDGKGIYTFISSDEKTIKCRANNRIPWITAAWQIKPSEE